MTAVHRGSPPQPRSRREGRYGRVGGARPHRRRPLRPPAARRRVEDRRGRTVPREHLTCRGARCGARRRIRFPQHLAVRRVAQIESVACVPAAIGERKRASGNGQGLEPCGSRARRRFPREYPGYVVFEGQRSYGVAPARLWRADPDRQGVPGAAGGWRRRLAVRRHGSGRRCSGGRRTRPNRGRHSGSPRGRRSGRRRR